MPKHTLTSSLRAAQNTEQDIEQTKRRAISRVSEVAPGIGGTLGPALLGLDAGATTFTFASRDTEPVVVNLPGELDCSVILHPTDTPGDGSGVVYRLAQVTLANNVEIEVRPPRKYADQV